MQSVNANLSPTVPANHSIQYNNVQIQNRPVKSPMSNGGAFLFSVTLRLIWYKQEYTVFLARPFRQVSEPGLFDVKQVQ